MSLRQLEYVQYDPRTLPLKFGQDGVSNSYDIQDMDKCRKKNIAWTNVIVTLGICSKISLKFFKNSFKILQNWASDR